MIEGTPNSRQLCEAISKVSGGACILGFSRGKDSLAAWLFARQFFDVIIPFHCAAVPHLSFVDESLDYYERFFGTPIARCFDGSVTEAITGLVYQPLEDEDAIDDLALTAWNNLYVADVLRRVESRLNAWCAFGISLNDSMERRIYVSQSKGKNLDNMSFYPCWDWPKSMVLETVEAAGLKLPKDYLLSNRTVAGAPAYRWLKRLEEVFPADFERVEAAYPLVRAELARNHFRTQHFMTAKGGE